MTQSEYEQKRAECGEEFCRANPSHNKSIFARKVFDFAFDRAYALGKETVTITQKDIDGAAVEYAASLSECGMYDKETPATKEDMKYTFKAGVKFALGKQEKDADTVTIEKEEYDKLCKYRRYAANWYWDFTTCPECGEFNPRGYICANCDNDKNWDK